VMDAPSAQTRHDDDPLVATASEVASLRDELAKAKDALAHRAHGRDGGEENPPNLTAIVKLEELERNMV
jgi:hypothetical protein